MTQVNTEHPESRLSLAEIEQSTGLSRDVLRKWELRYQFPLPQRGVRGQREFLDADLVKLLLISRLLKKGLRTSALVVQSTAQLQALLDQRSIAHALPPEPPELVLAQAVQALLESLAPTKDPSAVTQFLQRCLAQHGLTAFVAHLMPTFNHTVGEAWQQQRLSIAAEHRYTDSLRLLVLRALPVPGQAHGRPRVLLTTPPSELHSLGLLALHAQLALQGAASIDLGLQTPAAEVLRTARELHIGAVAISGSACLPAAMFQNYVNTLLAGLPSHCELWLGGNGCAGLDNTQTGLCRVFTDTPSAVQRWLLLAKAERTPSPVPDCIWATGSDP